MADKALIANVKETLDDSDLNEKQKLFCMHYIQSHNATQAYLSAYGGKKQVAGINGHRLLRNDKVRQELEKLRELQLSSLDISEWEYVKFLLKVAGADIGDYVTFAPQEIEVTDKDGSTTKATVSSAIVKDSATVDTSLIKSVKQQGASVHIELYDKQWAWERLNDFFGWTESRKAKEGSGALALAEAIESVKKRAREHGLPDNTVIEVKLVGDIDG